MELSIECGEVLRGHRLRFTGLRADGLSDDTFHSDYTEHHAGKPVHPLASLTYELTPGLLDETYPDGRYLDVTVELTPPADPGHWSAVFGTGSERDVADGGPVTRGAFGPFVCPTDTTSIRFELTAAVITTDGAPPSDDTPESTIGLLFVDLVNERAEWRAH